MHNSISKGYNNDESDETAGHTTADEMLDLKISLTERVFFHDSSYEKLEIGVRCKAMLNLLMLGKPLVGKPMAALHMRTPPMTSRLG